MQFVKLFPKLRPAGVSVAWLRPMNDRNDDDTFEPELDGFPTDLDPRRVRSRVQIEVLASEYADKARQGQNPSIDSYIERYPEMEAQIRERKAVDVALDKAKYEEVEMEDDLVGDLDVEAVDDTICNVMFARTSAAKAKSAKETSA